MVRKRRNQKEIPTPTKPRQEKTNLQLGTYTERTYRKPSEQLLPNRWPISYHNLN